MQYAFASAAVRAPRRSWSAEFVMTILNKVRYSFADRKALREGRRAQSNVGADGRWLSDVIRHHGVIEMALGEVAAAEGGEAKRRALQSLTVVMRAHSTAEESVIYPAMARFGQKTHAYAAYAEEGEAKMYLAALQFMDPHSDDFASGLHLLREALGFHFYQEESRWFPRLLKAAEEEENLQLSASYIAEFERYFVPMEGLQSST